MNKVFERFAEEDSAFITAIQTALVGQNVTVPYSGMAQWKTISGGIDRDTLEDSFKVMPRTPSRLEVRTCLINNITIREFMKWRRDEVGGDYAQDVLLNGWSKQQFANCEWHVTIKQDLVPENRVYQFSDPKFIGKAYELEATTMNHLEYGIGIHRAQLELKALCQNDFGLQWRLLGEDGFDLLRCTTLPFLDKKGASGQH